jgi:hypothetical protein
MNGTRQLLLIFHIVDEKVNSMKKGTELYSKHIPRLVYKYTTGELYISSRLIRMYDKIIMQEHFKKS